MFREFREFAIKGNAIDLAVGIVLGAAFGAIISSLVGDIIMPVVGILLGKVDLQNIFLVIKEGPKQAAPYATLAAAQAAGASVLAYGKFINAIVYFLIIAFSIFLVVKSINRFRRQEEAASRACPYCKSDVAEDATKCPSCTSEIGPASV